MSFKSESPPPPELTRQADEEILRDIKQEIDKRLFVYVNFRRCVDPATTIGQVLHPMSDEETRKFVAEHFSELWDKVLPQWLKDRYLEIKSRLDEKSTNTLPVQSACEPEGNSEQGLSKRKIRRPRKGESDKQSLVLDALVTHHRYQSGGSVENYTPASGKRLAELASGIHVKVSVATVSRFFAQHFPDRGYKGYEAACTRETIGRMLAKWQGEVPEELADLLPRESGRGEDD